MVATSWFCDAVSRPGCRFLSTASRAQKLAEETQKQWQETEGKRDIRMRFEFAEEDLRVAEAEADDAGGGTQLGSSAVDGMQTFRTVISAVDAINKHSKYTFSVEQTNIMNLLIQCALKQIFSETELIQHLLFLLEYFNIRELFEDLIVQMARRQGKTTVVSCFIAVILCALLNGNTNCFSSGSRISQELKNVVLDVVTVIIEHCEGLRNCQVTRDTAEQIRVRSIHNTINIFNAYPCNERTLHLNPPSLRLFSPFLSLPICWLAGYACSGVP